MSNVDVVVFQGVKFRRYPDADTRTERVYFTPGIADRQKGVGRLHEEIWKAAHGPIPDGHHIHHADHDPMNNDLGNLVCMTHADHIRHHLEADDAHERLSSDEWLQHLASIRDKAAAWHSSPEGKAWHSQHGAAVWAAREAVEQVCEQCGSVFENKNVARFCSNSCKSKWRRAAGFDNVERSCELCGSTFTTNKYSRVRFCSRSCSARHQHSRS